LEGLGLAVVSVTKLSELGGARRIDAEYYQPEYLILENEIMSAGFPVSRISEVSKFVKKGIFDLSPEFYREEGVPFVRVQNIRSGFLNEAELEFIPVGIHQSEIKTELEAHDLALSKVGTIGEVSIIPSKYDRANFSQNVIGIKVDKHKILPGYLLIFLLGRYGQLQIKRVQMPQVQSKLELEDIRCLKVVRLQSLEQEAHRRVLEAERRYEQSNLLSSQAENLLLEELGLKDFQPKYELSYSASLSKAFGVHRVDAEYFQPAYDEVTKRLIGYKNGYIPLLGRAEVVRPDFDPSRYPDTSFNYVELADIDMSIGMIRSASEIKGEEAPSRARRILTRGDVIVSSVEGSLEKVALVDKEYEGSLASTGFFQFRARGMQPEVLLVLSKSIALQAQLKKECTGTILTAVPNESLKRIVIPILPPDIRQRIAKLVLRSHEARRKARDLLEEAKKKVEQAIEAASS
jgi:type I restriction enzyme S subunit